MEKNNTDKEKITSNIANEFNIVWLRWIFLILITPLYLFLSNRHVSYGLIAIIVLSVAYNVLNHYALIVKRYSSKWFLKNIYFDIFLITFLVFFDGGLSSYIYTSYFIFIIYEGVSRNEKHPIYISLLTCILYAAVVYINNTEDIQTSNFMFRIIYIILSGIFVYQIVYQFKLYDKLHKYEHELARKDKLTGLFNRTELEDFLNEEIMSCVERRNIVSVMLFDLDNFKVFNDTYGHLMGDDLLRYFSKLIQETVSYPNRAFRYGGEEFLIVLKNTDLNEAYKVAETIRKKLSSSNIYINTSVGKHKVTVSCGISCCPEHSTGYFELLEYADKALYEAKSEGKNKVVIAEKE